MLFMNHFFSSHVYAWRDGGETWGHGEPLKGTLSVFIEIVTKAQSSTLVTKLYFLMSAIHFTYPSRKLSLT